MSGSYNTVATPCDAGHQAAGQSCPTRTDRPDRRQYRVKGCGQGEWQSQKHGEKQAKRWKTRHIGVDAQGRIVACTVTASHAPDSSQVPELLSQVDRVIERCIGDGICDHAPVYTAVEHHAPGARVLIPPRKDAVLSPWQLLYRPNATSMWWRLSATVGVPGNGRQGTTHRARRRTPFRASNGHVEAGEGRSGMRPKKGKPHWRASCSIGCRNGVVLSPMRSAESRVQGATATSCQFIQQSPRRKRGRIRVCLKHAAMIVRSMVPVDSRGVI